MRSAWSDGCYASVWLRLTPGEGTVRVRSFAHKCGSIQVKAHSSQALATYAALAASKMYACVHALCNINALAYPHTLGAGAEQRVRIAVFARGTRTHCMMVTYAALAHVHGSINSDNPIARRAPCMVTGHAQACRVHAQNAHGSGRSACARSARTFARRAFVCTRGTCPRFAYTISVTISFVPQRLLLVMSFDSAAVFLDF
eukprot:2258472-Pleurochrysis_carterae.AAC.1